MSAALSGAIIDATASTAIRPIRSIRWGRTGRWRRRLGPGRRARLDAGIVIPGEASSPLDRHPTLVIPAAVIAACLAEARTIRRARSRVVMDALMRPVGPDRRTRVGPA